VGFSDTIRADVGAFEAHYQAERGYCAFRLAAFYVGIDNEQPEDV
jgi:hypothetical protein